MASIARPDSFAAESVVKELTAEGVPWKLNRGSRDVDRTTITCRPQENPRNLVAEAGKKLLRKEVIQPQVLLQLPCYDFTPIMDHTLSTCPLAVSSAISSTTHFRDVTGGVYKARERIHRSVLICDY